MELNIKNILKCEDFDTSYLLNLYYNNDENFDFEKFKCFVNSFVKKANEFEEKTGVPKKHFSQKLNLFAFSKKCLIGYIKVKDIYAYINDDNDAVFLRDKKEIAKVKSKNIEKNWLIEQLDKIEFNYKKINRNENIDDNLYLSERFNIKKTSNFYIRYYLNSLYDIVVYFNYTYYIFFSEDNINEYSFALNGDLTDKHFLKIKRMLKINKIETKKYLDKKFSL